MNGIAQKRPRVIIHFRRRWAPTDARMRIHQSKLTPLSS
jgi:hypothetical protein